MSGDTPRNESGSPFWDDVDSSFWEGDDGPDAPPGMETRSSASPSSLGESDDELIQAIQENTEAIRAATESEVGPVEAASAGGEFRQQGQDDGEAIARAIADGFDRLQTGRASSPDAMTASGVQPPGGLIGKLDEIAGVLRSSFQQITGVAAPTAMESSGLANFATQFTAGMAGGDQVSQLAASRLFGQSPQQQIDRQFGMSSREARSIAGDSDSFGRFSEIDRNRASGQYTDDQVDEARSWLERHARATDHQRASEFVNAGLQQQGGFAALHAGRGFAQMAAQGVAASSGQTGVSAMKAASGVAHIAGGVSTALTGGPLGMAAAGVVEGFQSIIAASSEFDNSVRAMAGDLKQYSAEISTAEAMAKTHEIEGDIRRADVVGEGVGKYIEQTSEIGQFAKDIEASLMTAGVAIVNPVLEILKPILAWLTENATEAIASGLDIAAFLVELMKPVVEWFSQHNAEFMDSVAEDMRKSSRGISKLVQLGEKDHAQEGLDIDKWMNQFLHGHGMGDDFEQNRFGNVHNRGPKRKPKTAGQWGFGHNGV